MLVRKKPVVVEAVKWTGDNLYEVIELIGLHESAKKWTWDDYCDVVKEEGLKIFTLEGAMMASIGDYIIKGVNGECYPCKPDIFEKTYEDASLCVESNNESDATPYIDHGNRLLTAFPRDGALNEIYSTGEVDHRGVPVNYSIWRGNHSIMGMTGILFEKGFIEEADYQEGVEDIDLLEMVHDRLKQLQDYVENGEWIVQAIIYVEAAIDSLIAYQTFCRDVGDSSVC